MTEQATTRTAIITGASRGLGLALTQHLVADGWHVIVDARDGGRLTTATQRLGTQAVTAIPGDVGDPTHRAALVAAATDRERLDLLVNNASVLGGSPQPALAELTPEALSEVLAINTVAPLDLVRLTLPLLAATRGCVINVSSDAAAEPYPGWGAYGAAKAALDHATAILAVEHPDLAVYAVDPGDMATDLHQQAFPGEDLSDLPAPDVVVPALVHLLEHRPPSGRYRAGELNTAR